jgi:cyclopropane fatty-acyl-phospholipid synthase-like methyltransferase
MDPRKVIVRAAYDAIADRWGREREAMDDPREQAWIDRFCAALPGPRVLELGCGGGVVLRSLVARGLRSTGVDVSGVQLDRARAACPSAALVQGDLAEVEFAPASFDGVIAYDCLWHVPREEHGSIFAAIRRWVVDGAPLLISVAAIDDKDPREPDATLCGAPIYYSGWPRATTMALLAAARFEIVGVDDTADRALLVLARAR